MKTHQVKQYYTREMKKTSYLEIGDVDIHEDCLLLELQHAAYNQLRIYGANNQNILTDIISKLIFFFFLFKLRLKLPLKLFESNFFLNFFYSSTIR